MGWASPGLQGTNVPVQRLTGLLQAQGGGSPVPLECEIVAKHPILGSLGDLKTISLKPLGAYGVLPDDATPLIKVIDSSKVEVRGPAIDGTSYPFYPLYISHLGKGQIVALTFTPFKFLNVAERPKLMKRCVRYLASRPVE
jgi:hypothetical protein